MLQVQARKIKLDKQEVVKQKKGNPLMILMHFL